MGFFVIKNLSENKYILLKYWMINNDIIFNLKKIFSFDLKEITISVYDIVWKFIYIESNKKLKHWDFLMYLPVYNLDNWFLVWPYLDNLISKYIFDNYFSNFSLFQSHDEEVKMVNTNFKLWKYNIILDTIWQDYIEEKIDLDKIYNIYSTKYSIWKKIINENVINIKLDLNFKTEFDKISWNKYFLLCPIIDWHNYSSKVKISTLKKFKEIIYFLIDYLKWKQY